ncbi:hypothetical protein SAMN05444359_12179 [Neolewinella agarilytica]|uniref:Uncharacterized protein n=1 Tax=Neolewinella agarilytica TaxID=478744 RepID=A0A1H9KR05_9BACT|nr:hypothetical protein SAMN05444359_12179 [Neolewinella agarilytica]
MAVPGLRLEYPGKRVIPKSNQISYKLVDYHILVATMCNISDIASSTSNASNASNVR